MAGVSRAVVREIEEGAKAAFINEQMTRKRVEALEVRADGKDEEMQAVQKLLMRGLWGRLWWLISGR